MLQNKTCVRCKASNITHGNICSACSSSTPKPVVDDVQVSYLFKQINNDNILHHKFIESYQKWKFMGGGLKLVIEMDCSYK